MRLSITACLVLAFITVCSGCTMFRNPLVSKADPQEDARRRMVADLNARVERGDTEGARRILARMDESRNGSTAGSGSSSADSMDAALTAYEQRLNGINQAEISEMIDTLIASDSTIRTQQDVEQKRRQYQQLPVGRLQQMVASLDQASQIGQNRLDNWQMEQRPSRVAPESQPQTQLAGHQLQADQSSQAGAPRLPADHSNQENRYPARNDQFGQPHPWSGQQTSAAARATPGNDFRQAPDTTQQNRVPAVDQNPRQPVQPVAGVASNQFGGTYTANLQTRNPGGRQQGPLDNGQNQNRNALPTISPGTRNSSPEFSNTANAGAVSNSATGAIPGGVRLQEEITPLNVARGTLDGSGSTPQLQNGLQFGNPGSNPSGVVFGDQENGFGGTLTRGVQGIRDVTERGILATRNGFRGFIGNEQPNDIVGARLAAPPGNIDQLIAQLENELAVAAPGESESERLDYVRKHVHLRMLYLISGRVDQSIESIQGIDSADQEFWQQMFWAVSNYFDDQGMPHAGDRATQTLDQLRTAVARLRSTADLQLHNVSFCHRIDSYGNYARFSTDEFTPGQPVLLYAEVENFRSIRSEAEQFRTSLQSTIELYGDKDPTQPIETIPFDATEDLCRNQRRDYFHSYEFQIPQALEAGLYTLVLKVNDQLSQKIATSQIKFRVQ